MTVRSGMLEMKVIDGSARTPGQPARPAPCARLERVRYYALSMITDTAGYPDAPFGGGCAGRAVWV
jgi:hypothetical protein